MVLDFKDGLRAPAHIVYKEKPQRQRRVDLSDLSNFFERQILMRYVCLETKRPYPRE